MRYFAKNDKIAPSDPDEDPDNLLLEISEFKKA